MPPPSWATPSLVRLPLLLAAAGAAVQLVLLVIHVGKPGEKEPARSWEGKKRGFSFGGLRILGTLVIPGAGLRGSGVERTSLDYRRPYLSVSGGAIWFLYPGSCE